MKAISQLNQSYQKGELVLAEAEQDSYSDC